MEAVLCNFCKRAEIRLFEDRFGRRRPINKEPEPYEYVEDDLPEGYVIVLTGPKVGHLVPARDLPRSKLRHVKHLLTLHRCMEGAEFYRNRQLDEMMINDRDLDDFVQGVDRRRRQNRW